MTEQTTHNTPSYDSLDEIRLRKEEILKQLRYDDSRMKDMWNGLFHKPDTISSVMPSKRINTLVKTGTGAIDVAILAWKLYRKFKKKRFFGI